MNQLIPKRMFRAHDESGHRGLFFVLAHKHGPDGKLRWCPDIAEPVEEHVEHLEHWEETELAQSITRLKEVPVSEGTESIGVTQVAISAGPKGMNG